MSKLALDYLTELLPNLKLKKGAAKIEFITETPDKIKIWGILSNQIIKEEIVNADEAKNIMIKAILNDFNIM